MKNLLLQMSFSGRLSIMDSETPFLASSSNSIIPLSIAQRTNVDGGRSTSQIHQVDRRPAPTTAATKYDPLSAKYQNRSHHHQPKRSGSLGGKNKQMFCPCGNIRSDFDSSFIVRRLAKDLLEARTNLKQQHAQINHTREQHEAQLTGLGGQLVDFERSLRKTERDLKTQLQQKDKKISEQVQIINFLVKKTGTKCRDIKDLCNEAVAKIPQIQPIENLPSSSSPTQHIVDMKEVGKNGGVILGDRMEEVGRSSEAIIVNVKHGTSNTKHQEKPTSNKTNQEGEEG